jgi:hypothetical protein
MNTSKQNRKRVSRQELESILTKNVGTIELEKVPMLLMNIKDVSLAQETFKAYSSLLRMQVKANVSPTENTKLTASERKLLTIMKNEKFDYQNLLEMVKNIPTKKQEKLNRLYMNA